MKAKIKFMMCAVLSLSAVQNVNANNMAPNKCAELLGGRISDSPAIDHAIKINFIEIPPSKFTMQTDRGSVPVELTKPYGAMVTPLTQSMYARLLILAGIKDPQIVFPSHFTDGPNSVVFSFNNSNILMRPNDPVTNVSHEDAENILIKNVNRISQSNDENMQADIRKIISDHKKGDVYALLTDAQFANLQQLAKTIDGDTIDGMIERRDFPKLENYVVSKDNKSLGTRPVNSVMPLFINNQPIYINANAWEMTRDRVDFFDLRGGRDPYFQSGKLVAHRGGSWSSHPRLLYSSVVVYTLPDARNSQVTFRLARIARAPENTNEVAKGEK